MKSLVEIPVEIPTILKTSVVILSSNSWRNFGTYLQLNPCRNLSSTEISACISEQTTGKFLKESLGEFLKQKIQEKHLEKLLGNPLVKFLGKIIDEFSGRFLAKLFDKSLKNFLMYFWSLLETYFRRNSRIHAYIKICKDREEKILKYFKSIPAENKFPN